MPSKAKGSQRGAVSGRSQKMGSSLPKRRARISATRGESPASAARVAARAESALGAGIQAMLGLQEEGGGSVVKEADLHLGAEAAVAEAVAEGGAKDG